MESNIIVLSVAWGISFLLILALCAAFAKCLGDNAAMRKEVFALSNALSRMDKTTATVLSTFTKDIGVICRLLLTDYMAAHHASKTFSDEENQDIAIVLFNAARLNVASLTGDSDDTSKWTVVREMAQGLEPLVNGKVEIDAVGSIYVDGICFIETKDTGHDFVSQLKKNCSFSVSWAGVKFLPPSVS